MNTKNRWRSLFLILAAAIGLAAAQAPHGSSAADTAPAISSERLQKHINFLASPALKGRATGTPELNRAAQYIAGGFRKAGLEPTARKSYFQKFQVTVGAKLGKHNHADFLGPNGQNAQQKPGLRVGEEFIPLNFSDSGEARVPAVFAGYGITAPEYHYDDYAKLDVKDKAVIVLRHEPQEDDPKSVFEGREPTQHAQIVNKAINARNHGAKVMILVNDPVPHASEEDTLIKFGSLTGPESAGLLLIQVKQKAVENLLKASGAKSLGELEKGIDEKLEPNSFPVRDITVTLRVDVRRITAPTQNVVGILRGRDPKLSEEAVVIGAHYDHLGLGEHNSLAPAQIGKVHPGADDNASGTAALLELVTALAARRRDLHRSVVFIAFTGEELGLLGSSHYTKNPIWPLERTAAMINLDMVGRPRNGKINIGGVGTSPVFKQILEQANRTGLQLAYSESGYGSSDHTSFYVKNVPVLFFFSGLHSDYHKPSDTAEKIQAAEEARVTDLALRAAMALAVLDPRPQFVRVVEPRPMGGTGGGYGAYFGSIPDMGEEVKGVKFADVRDASPAAKAGLKAGDVLVEFAGAEIKNLYDFTYALRSHKPGEVVRVVVLRGTARVTADVKLEQRK
ncbi:MAG: M20/M25/M40 family metallo-hydrolase [Acidobacteria bacterium]|nr:M20/M25/M40 family metallo-hydrolase [Acidobacteriota bacterium]